MSSRNLTTRFFELSYMVIYIMSLIYTHIYAFIFHVSTFMVLSNIAFATENSKLKFNIFIILILYTKLNSSLKTILFNSVLFQEILRKGLIFQWLKSFTSCSAFLCVASRWDSIKKCITAFTGLTYLWVPLQALELPCKHTCSYNVWKLFTEMFPLKEKAVDV